MAANRLKGYAQVIALGDPRAYLQPDGSIDEAGWQKHLGLIAVDFPEPLQLSFGKPGQVARSIRCHPLAAEPFRQSLWTIHREGLWSDLKTYGGCYSFRMQRGSTAKISTHTWGLAADFDVLNNQLGEIPRISLAVVRIFEDAGFLWGGDFRRPDGMHVQLVEGY